MSNVTLAVCLANLINGVSNILAVFGLATHDEIVKGRDWYRGAHNEALRIGELYGIALLTVIKVACALSPRLEWSRNMPAAEAVVRWFVSGGFVPDIAEYQSGAMKLQRTHHSMGIPVIADDERIPVVDGPTKVNIVKGLWVLQGHDWILRGDKVNSFCDNILNHETSTAVTVDSHAIQVWRGIMEKGTYAVPPSMYAVIEADYRTAAASLGMTPLQLQAITWLTKKRVAVRGAADPYSVIAAANQVIAMLEKKSAA